MGLFDWIKPLTRHVEVEIDSVWTTKSGKQAGIRRAVERELSRPRPAALLLVAHFPSTLRELERVAASFSGEARLMRVVLAEELEANSHDDARAENSDVRVEMIVGERHPLRTHDDALKLFAGQLRCRCRITHHLSLDDALLQVYAGEWVKTVLQQLGVREDEALESHLVARRIVKAQGDVARKAVGDSPADSPEEWFRINEPETWQRVWG